MNFIRSVVVLNHRTFSSRPFTALACVALFACLSLLAPASSFAEVLELEGTVKAVDASARTITLERKTPKGTKTLELEVAKNAGDLSAVKVGSAISFSYQPDLELVTAISGLATDARSEPKLRTVEEIPGRYASLSSDGLVMAYESTTRDAPGGEIWLAHRNTVTDDFIGREQILVGRHPTLRGDGCEIVYVRKKPDGDTWTIWSAERPNTTAKFSRPRELPMLKSFSGPKCTQLSEDGLHLCFITSEPAIVPYVTSRDDLGKPWDKPKPLLPGSMTSNSVPYYTWPWLSADQRTLVAVREGVDDSQKGPCIFTRNSPEAQWEPKGRLDMPGISRHARCVRYVARTGELFLTEMGEGTQRIRIISPYTPSW